MPARVEDLSGLPPALIVVGTLDLFVDESLDYAKRLIRAGVSTELHVLPGAFHGSHALVPDAPISIAYSQLQYAALRQAYGTAP